MVDWGDRIRFGNPATGLTPSGDRAQPFTTEDGTPTNPTEVVLTVVKPDGTKLEYGWPLAGPDGTLTNEPTGHFYYPYTIDQSGPWTWELLGSGAVAAASTQVLRVAPRMVS